MRNIASVKPGQAIMPLPHELPVCIPNEPCGPQR
jgi:hypothetical protein